VSCERNVKILEDILGLKDHFFADGKSTHWGNFGLTSCFSVRVQSRLIFSKKKAFIVAPAAPSFLLVRAVASMN
jgi:hypothetical protein